MLAVRGIQVEILFASSDDARIPCFKIVRYSRWFKEAKCNQNTTVCAATVMQQYVAGNNRLLRECLVLWCIQAFMLSNVCSKCHFFGCVVVTRALQRSNSVSSVPPVVS